MNFIDNRCLMRKRDHFSYYMRKHAQSAWLEKPHNDLKPVAAATGSRVSQLRFVCITLVGRFLMGFRDLMEDLAIAITSHAFGCAIVMHVAYFPMDRSDINRRLGRLPTGGLGLLFGPGVAMPDLIVGSRSHLWG